MSVLFFLFLLFKNVTYRLIIFRKAWAHYFDLQNLRVLFFSALNAQSEQESLADQPLPQVPEENEDEETEPTTSSEESSKDLTPDDMCKDFDDASVTSSSDQSTLCDEDESDYQSGEEGEPGSVDLIFLINSLKPFVIHVTSV